MDCTQALKADLDLINSASRQTMTLTHSLTNSQKLLLCWHYRLSHMNFSKIHDLARQGHLPKHIANCEQPICSSCQYGKAHRWPVTSSSKLRPIDVDDLKPGDHVSVDLIESPATGMVDTYSGKPTTAWYHAASLYTDHASQYRTEAVFSKQKFEQLAATFGVKIKSYRADNGIMAKREFMQNIDLCQQSIIPSRVNQHSQTELPSETFAQCVTEHAPCSSMPFHNGLRKL